MRDRVLPPRKVGLRLISSDRISGGEGKGGEGREERERGGGKRRRGGKGEKRREERERGRGKRRGEREEEGGEGTVCNIVTYVESV